MHVAHKTTCVISSVYSFVSKLESYYSSDLLKRANLFVQDMERRATVTNKAEEGPEAVGEVSVDVVSVDVMAPSDRTGNTLPGIGGVTIVCSVTIHSQFDSPI